MNCLECRENLVAYVEGLLDDAAAAACRSHIQTCADCRAEEHAVIALQQDLVALGRTGAEASLVAPVMRRIHEGQQEERAVNIVPLTSILKWTLGLGAATASVALAILFFVSTNGTASAAEIMAKGAEIISECASVYLRGSVRSAPGDNFSILDSKRDFVTVEVWKEHGGQGRWRVEKPGRVAVMDGRATVLYIEPYDEVTEVPATPGHYLPLPAPTQLPGGPEVPAGWAPFDTGWLHQLANIGTTLTRELERALENDWAMDVVLAAEDSGHTQTIVSIEARSGLPSGDYLQNKFFNTADTLREYRFDAETGVLEGMRVILHEPTGDVVVFEVDQIVCGAPLAPSVFELDLPESAVKSREPEVLPDNERYATMTPEEAARAFFEACGREDWDEVEKFWSPLNDRFKVFLGGIEVLDIGESFTSAAYPGRFVPYTIRFRSGEVKEFNLALKRHSRTQRWYVDGGI